MAETVSARRDEITPVDYENLLTAPVLCFLASWFLAIVYLGNAGAFQPEPGEPAISILAAVILPPIAFLLSYFALPRLRVWVSRLDLVLITMLQSWRIAGALFLPLWVYGLLPGAFAIPAGFGDIAVGVAAPFVALAVMRKSPAWKVSSYGLIAAGLFDFAIAVGTGVLTDESGYLLTAGAPTSELVNILPLSLIPTFLVPCFIILHLIAFLKLRQAD